MFVYEFVYIEIKIEVEIVIEIWYVSVKALITSTYRTFSTLIRVMIPYSNYYLEPKHPGIVLSVLRFSKRHYIYIFCMDSFINYNIVCSSFLFHVIHV